MKELLKNLGLILILIGVIFLAVIVFMHNNTNAKMVVSLTLIVVGFVAHIVINKLVS